MAIRFSSQAVGGNRHQDISHNSYLCVASGIFCFLVSLLSNVDNVQFPLSWEHGAILSIFSFLIVFGNRNSDVLFAANDFSLPSQLIKMVTGGNGVCIF